MALFLVAARGAEGAWDGVQGAVIGAGGWCPVLPSADRAGRKAFETA